MPENAYPAPNIGPDGNPLHACVHGIVELFLLKSRLLLAYIMCSYMISPRVEDANAHGGSGCQSGRGNRARVTNDVAKVGFGAAGEHEVASGQARLPVSDSSASTSSTLLADIIPARPALIRASSRVFSSCHDWSSCGPPGTAAPARIALSSCLAARLVSSDFRVAGRF